MVVVVVVVVVVIVVVVVVVVVVVSVACKNTQITVPICRRRQLKSLNNVSQKDRVGSLWRNPTYDKYYGESKF